MVLQATILNCKAMMETSWADEMNFGMNHAPCAISITHPVDLQSTVFPFVAYHLMIYPKLHQSIATNS